MKIEKIKNKKSLKGMTLAEIIVSLAILAVLTVVLVGTSGLIDKYTKSANRVNKIAAAQTPVAETKDLSKSHRDQVLDGDGNPVVDGDGNPTYHEATISFSYKKGTDDRTATVKGFLYNVDDSSTSTDEVGGNLNMKFIDNLEYEAAAPETTTAPPESPDE